MSLRPIDLARAAGISAQQVRRYEALGLIPPARRGTNGYRNYTEDHREALLAARAVLAGLGWERGFWAIHHLLADRPERAFAIADRVHTELHQARRRALEIIDTLRGTAHDSAPLPSLPVTIRGAARHVGVTVSAVRHWEREGLVTAHRDEANAYRRYSRHELQRLSLVALLRAGGYPITLIRDLLESMDNGDAQAAVAAAERRLDEINQASIRCASATGALHERFKALSSG